MWLKRFLSKCVPAPSNPDASDELDATPETRSRLKKEDIKVPISPKRPEPPSFVITPAAHSAPQAQIESAPMADKRARPTMVDTVRTLGKKFDSDMTGQAKEHIKADEVVVALCELGWSSEESRRMISAADALNDDGSVRLLDLMKHTMKEAHTEALVSRLRFRIGARVLCRISFDWSLGTIVALNYREPNWPPGKTVPYQVKLDDGPLIYVPVDKPQVCKEFVPPWWEQFIGTSAMALREASAGKNINERNPSGMCCLHVATSANWLEGVDELIRLKADVNLHDRKYATALHKAASLPNAQLIVRKLCAARAEVNLQDLNPEYDPEWTSVTFGDQEVHRTPLHYSSEKGYLDTMRILIESQADVNMQDGAMKTPLHLAIQEDESDAVDLLIQSGADVHLSCLRSGMKNSPLMDAAHVSNHLLAEKLIRARANINQQGKSDMAAIHLAARQGDAKMVQILLSARADIMQQSKCGTALSLAKQKGGEELLKVLGVANSQNSTDSVSSVAKISAAQRAALFMD